MCNFCIHDCEKFHMRGLQKMSFRFLYILIALTIGILPIVLFFTGVSFVIYLLS